MSSQVFCVCGNAIDEAATGSAAGLCRSCADRQKAHRSDWQTVHGSDQEDHYDANALGLMRPAPGHGAKSPI